MPAQGTRRSFVVLDALRGVAAIAVALGHFGMLLPCIFYFQAVCLPVDFFFCLSGFVISHAYEDKLRLDLTPLRFLLLRLARLYPFYLLGTAIGMVQWLLYRLLWTDPLTHAITLTQFLLATLASVLYLPSIPLASMAKTLQFPFDQPAWSLSFELLVNIIFAFVAKQLSTRLLSTLIAGFGVLLALTAFYHGRIDGGLEWYGLIGIARSGYSFFTGVLLRRYWRAERTFSISYLWLIGAFLLIIGVTLPAKLKPFYDLAVIYMAFPFLVYVAASIKDGNAQVSRAFRRIGAASYGLYAIHFPAMTLLATMAPKIYGHHDYFPSLLYAVMFVALLLAAVLRLEKSFDIPVRARLTRRIELMFGASRQPSARPSSNAGT